MSMEHFTKYEPKIKTDFFGQLLERYTASKMSLEVETASKKMFNWFVMYSSVPKLLANNNVKNIVWEMCASPFRAIFEEAIALDMMSDQYDDDLIEVSNKFYDIVNGLMWDSDMDIDDDMHGYFEKRLNTLRANLNALR